MKKTRPKKPDSRANNAQTTDLRKPTDGAELVPVIVGEFTPSNEPNRDLGIFGEALEGYARVTSEQSKHHLAVAGYQDVLLREAGATADERRSAFVREANSWKRSSRKRFLAIAAFAIVCSLVPFSKTALGKVLVDKFETILASDESSKAKLAGGEQDYEDTEEGADDAPVLGWEDASSDGRGAWIYHTGEGYEDIARGWFPIDGGWYYFEPSTGVMMRNTWVEGCWLGQDGRAM